MAMSEVPIGMNPVMLGVERKEIISDPFVREAYFDHQILQE